jgi:hypothetical protein
MTKRVAKSADEGRRFELPEKGGGAGGLSLWPQKLRHYAKETTRQGEAGLSEEAVSLAF